MDRVSDEREEEAAVEAAFQTVFRLSEAAIMRYQPWISLLLDRFGPRFGWAPMSQSASEWQAAHEILNRVRDKLELVQEFFSYYRTDLIIAIQARADPRTASLDLGKYAENEAKFLYVLCALWLDSRYIAQFPEMADEIRRLISREPRSRGQIPTFATRNGFPLEPTRKGVQRGRKLSFLRSIESGLPLLFTPVVSLLDHVDYPDLPKISLLLRLGAYGDILELARKLSPDMNTYEATYDRHVALRYQQYVLQQHVSRQT
ncbi:hypothetical protein VTN77DRAFT_3176 [Rasamsonia byssochlamydoides]|uniref:uncharacterized protein n=1 Tax=Rasamsonia byssochlamydoides TaxID=89139 RepID=UPI003743CE1B